MTTDDPMFVGQRVELRRGEHGLSGDLQEVTRRQLVLRPIGSQRPNVGDDVELHFVGDDATYMLPTKVIEVLEHPVPRIVVGRDDKNLRRVQRREFFRVTAKVKVQLGAVSTTRDGHTRDISAGGAMLVLHREYKEGTQLRLRLYLPDDAPPLRCMANVIRTRPGDFGEFLVAVEYDQLGEPERTRIVRLLFRLQTELANAT